MKEISYGDNMITFKFPYDATLVKRIKASIPGVHWDSWRRVWYVVPSDSSLRDAVKFGKNYDFAISDILINHVPKVVEEMKRQEYTQDTSSYTVSRGQGHGGKPFNVGFEPAV